MSLAIGGQQRADPTVDSDVALQLLKQEEVYLEPGSTQNPGTISSKSIC